MNYNGYDDFARFKTEEDYNNWNVHACPLRCSAIRVERPSKNTVFRVKESLYNPFNVFRSFFFLLKRFGTNTRVYCVVCNTGFTMIRQKKIFRKDVH